MPIIIGFNSAEVPAGFVNATSKEQLPGLFGSTKAAAAAAYDPEGTTEFARLLTQINTDKVWAEPARFTTQAYAAKGQPAYIHLFAYVSPSMQQYIRYGAAHASEILSIFGSTKSQSGAPVAPKDQEVAALMNT